MRRGLVLGGVQAEFVASAFRVQDFPAPGPWPEIALVGHSNAGKSTLVNKLTGTRALARVSSTPGRTASVNFYRLSGEGMILVDLPGYGYRRSREVEPWDKLCRTYLRRPSLSHVLVLMDCRRDLGPTETAFLRGHMTLPGVQVSLVLTKTDKLGPRDLAARRSELEKGLTWIQRSQSSLGQRPITAFWVQATDEKTIALLRRSFGDRPVASWGHPCSPDLSN